MQIKAKLTFHYQNNNQAKIAHCSLEPDNMDFIKSTVQNHLMICEVEGQSLNSVLATLDDLIFSEIIVENVLNM